MTIKLDVLVIQIIHIVILFWVFKKLIGSSLADALLARRTQVEKLENADLEYQEKLALAQENADQLLQEWIKRKEEIIAEWVLVAQKKSDEIVSNAQKQAERITSDAVDQVKNLEKELKDWFVDGVKHTTKLVVNKLITDKPELNSAYIDGLVQEFTASK